MKSVQTGFLLLFLPLISDAQLRFEVTAAAGLLPGEENGRLIVAIAPRQSPDPLDAIGSAERMDARVFARDADRVRPGSTLIVTTGDEYCPRNPLPCSDARAHEPLLPPGKYFARAVFMWNGDLLEVRAPGNLYSRAIPVAVGAQGSDTVRMTLTEAFPPDEPPPDTRELKFVKIRSHLLSEFHGRPIFLRGAVLLPRDFEKDTTCRYPLIISIGGYGARYDEIRHRMSQGSSFRRQWMADSLPGMIRLYLDGRGPYGDPYQVNSENNGPYGDALLTELMPYVEKRFRAIGTPSARFLEGASTGGWVSLALQVFYPDSFNGTWSQSPDGVDFRAFELVDIYRDENAFVNGGGFERPAARNVKGEVLWTMRHEVQMENVLGRGNSYTMSGDQWGSWNAVYGPRGTDGRPVPLWDPHTGVIDHTVADRWRRYDIRAVLEGNWKILGPKLRGKLHIWVGDADDFFLNNAVHLLDAFLSKADPPPGGWIRYGPGKGHVSMPMSEYEMLREMERAYVERR